MQGPLSQKLGSVRETSVRLGWFSSWIQRSPLDEVGERIEELLGEAETFRSRATPALVTLTAWIAGAVAPPHLHALARWSRQQALFRTHRMLAHASDCPEEFGATPEAQVPEYIPGRRVTLGERKNLARRLGRSRIDLLIHDPHPAVIEQLFNNPHLTEPDVIRLVTLRPARAGALIHLFREGRWFTSRRVRMGLLLNPGLPLWQSVPLLWLCSRPELAEIKGAQHLDDRLRAAASTSLNRHPPIPDDSTHPLLH